VKERLNNGTATRQSLETPSRVYNNQIDIVPFFRFTKSPAMLAARVFEAFIPLLLLIEVNAVLPQRSVQFDLVSI
jgi:hypothetical protein